MNKTFGASSGALGGVYGPQSATESITSRLMTPLNVGFEFLFFDVILLLLLL
jgi:hypothetical protein